MSKQIGELVPVLIILFFSFVNSGMNSWISIGKLNSSITSLFTDSVQRSSCGSPHSRGTFCGSLLYRPTKRWVGKWENPGKCRIALNAHVSIRSAHRVCNSVGPCFEIFVRSFVVRAMRVTLRQGFPVSQFPLASQFSRGITQDLEAARYIGSALLCFPDICCD